MNDKQALVDGHRAALAPASDLRRYALTSSATDSDHAAVCMAAGSVPTRRRPLRFGPRSGPGDRSHVSLLPPADGSWKIARGRAAWWAA